MIAILRRWGQHWLGRGDSACSVPPFDGVLKPNQKLETATVLARFEDANDLATDGCALWVADGPRVWRLDTADGAKHEVAVFDDTVTALACDGRSLAVALGGRSVRLLALAADGTAGGAAAGGRRWSTADDRHFLSVNALAFMPDGHLLATEGSATYGCEQWSHDLMTLGRGGRLCRLDLDGSATTLKNGLAHAFGACVADDGRIWLAESWRHRVLALAADGREAIPLLERLPGYPSRLSPARGGGVWLTVFTCRTQLVELVLREPVYRQRMVAEIDPRYWVTPALVSGRSFLEPLQGGGVKTMGVLKPWAPPRSYGLVIRLGADGRPQYAMHSRVGGQHHGVVAAVELDGALHALAKGSGSVLQLAIGTHTT